MKKTLKVKEADSLDKLEPIDRRELKLLWNHESWDGPISGMCLYRGEKCWFQMFMDPDDPECEKLTRRYLLIELSNEQIEEQEYWQNLFLEKVGGNNVFDENGIRRTDRPKQPPQKRKEFYESFRKRQP